MYSPPFNVLEQQQQQQKSQVWIHTLLGLIYATCPMISHTISNNDKDTI